MKPHHSLLFFMLRFVPALVFSLASSVILTLPLFQKSIADSRIGEIQKEIDAAQQYIDANWRKGYHADGSVNTNVKTTLNAKRGIIADNIEEIRKIRKAPLQSRELSFIEQMETVVEGAMTNRIDLFLHLFFWLFFFTVEMIPLILFYLDQNDDSYTATTEQLEEWRIKKAFEEITRQNKNEILAKQVETIETVYQNHKKVKEYEIKIAQLDLEQRKALHHIKTELSHLESENVSAAPETIIPPDEPPKSDLSSWSPHKPPAPNPATDSQENAQPAPTADTPGDEQPEGTTASNGALADSKDADFLKRLQRLTGDV